MIDLQNILRMVKANENDKPRYGNLVKSQDGERSNAARHKALVASSRNAGITPDGLLKPGRASRNGSPSFQKES